MQIAQDAVVSLDYTLTDDSGEVIDSSEGDVLSYLHGHGQLVPGLERELEGRRAGDSFSLTVSPTDGYGEHEPDLLLRVPRAELPSEIAPEVGLELTYEGPDEEPMSMWVVGVDEAHVQLDGNHPLAGQTLHFSIEVRDVRVATKLELEHGHVHEGDDDHGDAETYTH